MQKLDEIFNDSKYAKLFEMNKAEQYGDWSIYEQDGKTIASRLDDDGAQVYHTTLVGALARQALKSKIDGIAWTQTVIT